ncbi:hypothetical protein F4779DRAFT_356567 [Xylariaceae sp. FL0662B]|nr:hypothetical protein F4779DRAFT_356567 [Xylariaceae sp. FL0662B]
MAAEEAHMPFIKHLASSDRKTRTTALTTLRTFLSAPSTARRLGPLDHLKLWKGLFYSLWMCDRPQPQQRLCGELAGLVDVLPTTTTTSAAAAAAAAASDDDVNDGGVVVVVSAFLAAFWATMAREWTAIDVLRMEKFLLLVRRVLGASLAWALDHDGNGNGRGKTEGGKGGRRKKGGNRIDTIINLLREWPFEATGDLSKVPVGLRLHCLDIWVDEVERLGLLDEDREEGERVEEKRFLDQIRGLVDAQTRSTCKPVRARAKESLADERLPWNRRSSGGGGDDDDDEMAEDVAAGKDSWDGFED